MKKNWIWVVIAAAFVFSGYMFGKTAGFVEGINEGFKITNTEWLKNVQKDDFVWSDMREPEEITAEMMSNINLNLINVLFR